MFVEKEKALAEEVAKEKEKILAEKRLMEEEASRQREEAEVGDGTNQLVFVKRCRFLEQSGCASVSSGGLSGLLGLLVHASG